VAEIPKQSGGKAGEAGAGGLAAASAGGAQSVAVAMAVAGAAVGLAAAARGPRRGRPPSTPSRGATPGWRTVVGKGRIHQPLGQVVKGGRRFSFSAWSSWADNAAESGVGLGKGGEVSDAIRKGGEIAKTGMVPDCP